VAVIGYRRDSDDEVGSHQRDALAGAACERVYVDRATGPRARRPELQKALSSLREGDVFVVSRLDRLGGTLAEVVALMASLDDRGVAFRSIDDDIDELGAWGRFFFRAAGALASYESTIADEPARAAERRRQEAHYKRRGAPALSRRRLQIARDMLRDEASLVDVARHLDVPLRTLREGLAEAEADRPRDDPRAPARRDPTR